MLHSTKKTQEDILNTQNYAENDLSKESSSELIHKEPIENTPLWVIGNKETGYFLSIHNYRITEIYNTIDEAKDRLKIESWNIIARLTGIIIELQKKFEYKQIEIEQQREENKNQSSG